mmetsp:Transcript_71501/g.115375  ORF Transcript_71501/g.115375 Transcript_71501/m.115375 type:complete len:211 (+) Transcript_71501:69-701(+)
MGSGASSGAYPAGMQWLLSAVDKEKQEKQWLANKYDEKCAEVEALTKELKLLSAGLGPRAVCTAGSASAAVGRDWLRPLTEKAQGSEGKETPSLVPEVTEAPEIKSQAPPKLQSNLTQRRGVSLSLSLTKDQSRKPVEPLTSQDILPDAPGAGGHLVAASAISVPSSVKSENGSVPPNQIEALSVGTRTKVMSMLDECQSPKRKTSAKAF